VILKNQKIFLGPRQFTTDLAAVAIEGGVEPQDDTVFGDSTRQFEAGLHVIGWSMEGFWSSEDGAGDVDPALFGNLSLNGVPLTILAESADVGDRAFATRIVQSEYHFGGTVGDIHKFTASGEVTERLVRALTLFNGTAAASADGTGVQVGAAATGETVFAALHVVSASPSDTLDVEIESDDDVGFGSPTTRFTFAQATDETSEFLTLAGPVTDDWWRIAFTIGGTDPSFTFAVVLGIH
jgi:hypothetical protein